jgi:hypothetical protein
MKNLAFSADSEEFSEKLPSNTGIKIADTAKNC